MNGTWIRRMAALGAGMLCLLGCQRALACSTCFGDPESGMAKGAVMGVVTLMAVVVVVLGGVAGTGLFWLQRSRRLTRRQTPSSDESS